MNKTYLNNNPPPLVSIIIITYNSNKYVLETLESAKTQIYQNIELIVSDDYSTDNTVEICRQWIDENKGRFVRTELLTVEKNSGIPANCNRGVKAAFGEWIKLIAGDDILDNRCISKFINYINNNNNNIYIVTSITQTFKINKGKRYEGYLVGKDNGFLNSIKITSAIQYKLLLLSCFIHAPNVIFKKELIMNVGFFDENISFMEDYPFWLNVTKNGFKFNYLNEVTVYYRIHDKSMYNNNKNDIIFNDFYKKSIEFNKKYIYPNVHSFVKYMYLIDYYIKIIYDKLGMNKNNKINKSLYLFICKISPLYLFKKYYSYAVVRINGL